MELKLKLGDVLVLGQTLKSIIDDNDAKIDTLFKFKLLGILKSLDAHVANFETIRNEKIMEYGEKTEDGNIQINNNNKEAIKKFNNSITKLINSDVIINSEPLKATDMFNKGVKAEYLMGLYPIIKE